MQKARTSASQKSNTSQSQLEFQLGSGLQPKSTEIKATGTRAPKAGTLHTGAPDSGAPDSGGEMDQDDAPTFAMVRESGIDGEKRCLYLVAESTNGESFRLDFTPGCIPLVIAALSSELGFLSKNQPERQDVVQPIVIDACHLGETAAGHPALLAEMEGGGELPLQMRLQDLRQLSHQIDQYIRARAWGRQ